MATLHHMIPVSESILPEWQFLKEENIYIINMDIKMISSVL